VLLAQAQDAMWRLRYGFPQFLVLGPEERRQIVAEEPLLYAEIRRTMDEYAATGLQPVQRQALAEWKEAFEKYVQARPRWFQLEVLGITFLARRAPDTQQGGQPSESLDANNSVETPFTRNTLENLYASILERESRSRY
jgi:hypothetical protein